MPVASVVLVNKLSKRQVRGGRSGEPLVALQEDHKVVALTLAPNEEQLLAAMDDGSLWGLDLTRLNNLPVRPEAVAPLPLQTTATVVWNAKMACRPT